MGALLAWRTRRLDERPVRRYGRWLLVGIAAVLVLYELVYRPALAGVATHRVRWDVPLAKLGAGFQTVGFPTSDGVRLAGWYVPSRNRAAVIVSPGRSAEAQAHVRMLTRHGYGVLVFDRRGEGASERDFNVLGWRGERDVRGAVAFPGRRPDVDANRIGGLGLSVGGEMLLEAAARSPGLRAVISDGAGRRSIREHTHLSGLAKWQLMPQMAVVSVAHVFTARSVTVTHRVGARRSGTVTVRFPVYGDHSAIRARRTRGRLRALILTAEHDGYTVTFLQLPARARLRVITCACQPSAPHTRRVAQIGFPLRERQTRTVTVRLTPR
jgi:hypothetical protein